MEGRELGWPASTFGMLARGPGSRRLRRAPGAAQPGGPGTAGEPTLFRLRTPQRDGGRAGVVRGIAARAGAGLYLELGLGYTPLQAGLTQAPWALGIAAGSALSGAVLAARLGRTGLQIGAVVAAAGLGGVLLTVTMAGQVTGWALAP